MACLVRVWRVSLISGLWLALTAPAWAATNIFMSITGAQGPIQGEAKSPHGAEWIPILEINETVAASRDAASGQATGKRQHEPIRIVKEVDVASPKLQNAAARGEHLKEVVFQFYRDVQGKQELYHTIR